MSLAETFIGNQGAHFGSGFFTKILIEREKIPSMRICSKITFIFIIYSLSAATVLGNETQWRELNVEIFTFYRQGKYQEAAEVAERALNVAQETFGPDHQKVAISLNNLATLYRILGKYPEAERLYQRALLIKEKAFGLNHPEVATTLNNLAGLYKAQGKYSKAEPLYQRALKIREKTLSTDHPDLGQSLNNLALLYKIQGRYAKAEPLYKRALAIWEKVLYPDDPAIKTLLENMLELYKQLDKQDEVIKIKKRLEKIHSGKNKE